MKKLGVIDKLNAIADAVLYENAVEARAKINLAGIGSDPRGRIPVPLTMDGRLWIAGAVSDKLIEQGRGIKNCAEWAHVMMREVVPIGAWNTEDPVTRDPDERILLDGYRGYCVFCPETQQEFVLTGERMYLMQNEEPYRWEGMAAKSRARKRGNQPPELPANAQMSLNL